MDTYSELKVLIADDSAALRQRLNRMIANISGVSAVVEVDNGIEAMAVLETLRPNAVILDIRMPGRSGMEVLLEAKKILPSAVVIMLTNYPYPAYRTRCLESGASYFFDKNTEFMKVIEVLNHLVKAPGASMTGPVEPPAESSASGGV